MAKRSLIHQFNKALEQILANPNAFPSATDAELASLLSLASDLRHLPREDFRANLKRNLLRAAKGSKQKFTEEKSMTTAVQYQTTAVPYLSVRNANAAIEFYKNAFGASEILRLEEPDGRIGHAEIRIGEATIMLADEYPEYGIVGPQSIGTSGVSIHLAVEDAHAFFERAVAAGAKIIRPVQDEFYGERSGKIQDPFGHTWFLSQHIEDVSAEEMQKRYDDIMKAAETSGQPIHPPQKSQYIPVDLRNLTPVLHTHGTAQLIDFLKRAFNAEEYDRTEMPNGMIMHAKVRIGESVLEMGEAHGEFPAMTSALHLYVRDSDAAYKQAIEAGATSVYAPTDMPYGDREGGVKDPFGNYWYIATHISDRSSEPLLKDMKETPAQIREGFQTVTPYLMVNKAEQLVDFVKKAFDAIETFRTIGTAGGLHAEVKIGTSMVMIGGREGIDEVPGAIYLYVNDVDSIYQRAIKAGAVSVQEPVDQPYGDRNAWVRDPFGNTWFIASQIRK